jgi:hypothetical protein
LFYLKQKLIDQRCRENRAIKAKEIALITSIVPPSDCRSTAVAIGSQIYQHTVGKFAILTELPRFKADATAARFSKRISPIPLYIYLAFVRPSLVGVESYFVVTYDPNVYLSIHVPA